MIVPEGGGGPSGCFSAIPARQAGGVFADRNATTGTGGGTEPGLRQ